MTEFMGAIAITGVSGFLGQSLLRAWGQGKRPFERVVGIDIRWPAYRPPWLVFYNHDVREQVLASSLIREKVDQLVHLANPQVPMRDENLRSQIVVGGSKNVLHACATAGVKHVLMLSSTVVYGPGEDLDVLINEDAPLRGHPRFGYARELVKLELLSEEFSRKFKDIPVTILRANPVLGPRVNNFWARFLLKVPFLPRSTATPPQMQFLHLSDLVRAMQAAVATCKPGAFNIAGKGRISLEAIGAMLGKKVVWIPAMALYPLYDLAYFLRLGGIDVPSSVLDYLLHPTSIDADRARQELGFEPRLDSTEALRSLIEEPPR